MRKGLKKLFYIIIFACAAIAGATSCKKNVPEQRPYPEVVDQTVFMYLPWSDDLTGYFYDNLTDFETAISKMNLWDQRVVAFMSTSTTEGTLFELKYSRGNKSRNVLKTYSEPEITTAEWITSVLEDVKYYAPANNYAMTIGCHGLGWLPVPAATTLRAATTPQYHWEQTDAALTRFFGGKQARFRTEISALAEGIAGAGLNMEYILFDDCYMSCIEVAYELKNVTDHLIACPTEIMAYGMPYAMIGKYLVGNVDYAGIADEFYAYYSNNGYFSFGTIGVTVCSEVDALAAIMKEINQLYTFDDSQLNQLQKMDGYTPVIFFDMGDYVSKLCSDPNLLFRFNEQLERTVPPAFKKHTEYFYSALPKRDEDRVLPIDVYSGVTISDPSVNNMSVTTKLETAWYAATH